MANEVIYSESAPDPIGPYSQAIKSGNMLFISGQIALNHSGQLVNSSLEEETKQVMTNLAAVLGAGNYDFSHVVKCTIFLKDMDDFPKVNALYGSYFTTNPPARETVEVSKLPKDVRVEISCIAIK